MSKLNNMFFEFRHISMLGDKVSVSPKSSVVSDTAEYSLEYAKNTIFSVARGEKLIPIELVLGFEDNIKNAIGNDYVEHQESYALEIKTDKITLYGSTERGLIYAVSTLKQLLEQDELAEMVLFDYPAQNVRGYRVYSPGKRNLEKFKAMIDMLVYYKYNTLIMEVGGAMEYKRHPEINEKWCEFCDEVNQSPYEAKRIQEKTFKGWRKNSIHTDNGDGGYITQDEMRDIVLYAKERKIEVIPEVPTLSHADYIVRAFPELNERVEDYYPDTYCPSNPKSYEIVFDILDEVIEVFQPNYINIGHDECYTICICDKCKDKDPVELYTGDIRKINDYLKEKGIKSMIWGEKVYGNKYTIGPLKIPCPIGGTADPKCGIPEMSGCAGKIPKDVTLLQWYWSKCTYEEEKNICDMGYNMIYGNFIAINLENYPERMKQVQGGIVSNWGSVDEEYMQRNCQNHHLLTTAWIFWNGNYNNHMAPQLNQMVKEELYNRYVKTLGQHIIQVEHTTSYSKDYTPFWCGYYIVPEDWLLGWHVVTYKDGKAVNLPVVFGYNIRNAKEIKQELDGIQETEAVGNSDIEAMGASYPFVINGKQYYRTAYTNPYPEKEIVSISFVSKDGIEVETERYQKKCVY